MKVSAEETQQTNNLAINDKDTVEQLVLLNRRLVYHIIKERFPSEFYDDDKREELYSAGLEGLLKAAQYFNKDKGF
ncbi:MAG TPA: hypothetical protein PKK61_08820, partial [Defluviitaleaceae bacterium]|nr:hypothetical protein [Defluviitaleaceae bacterium]